MKLPLISAAVVLYIVLATMWICSSESVAALSTHSLPF